jgi:RHS repeat-associated protein
MMPAAKHGDPQLGVDVHLCIVPPSPSPVPLPTPHMSIVFDPMDYLPIFGATVTVCGMKRAVAGTAGQAVHIPPGFPFAPKLPDKDDELFMGSTTVEADGDPFSFLGVPVLSCQVAGMASPLRPKRKGGPRLMMLPTVFNLAIPTNVFIGGPPTISLMGMALKLGFKLGFAGLGKLAKTKFAKAVGKRFRNWRKAKFGHIKSDFIRCKILRAEPVNIVTGAVAVEQEDFVLPGLLPIRWTRRYESDNPRRGACGVGWECPADARLEHDAESGVVLLHHPEGGIAIFPALPSAEGDSGAVLELMDGALLSDHEGELRVRTKEDRIYHFPKALALDAGNGQREYPLARVEDLCGNALSYERSGARVVAIREAGGRRITLEPDTDGLIRRVALHVPDSDFHHIFVEYDHDTAADLVEVRDALGQPYRFAYEQHHMLRHTDRNGLSFYYQYDKSGEAWRVVRSWGDGGLYAYEFAYLDAENERRITDSLGHVSLVKLDERGLPISEIDPLEGTTFYEYDEAGRTTSVVDQDGHRTEYEYDDSGNLLTLTRPDGKTVLTEFDAAGRAVAIVDPTGARWQQKWDARGLLVEDTTPQGHVWRYEYDARGQLAAFVNPRGARTDLAFDGVGNLAGLRDALGHRKAFAYDALGNVTRALDPLGNETLYRYDATSRLIGTRLPSGGNIACAYDAEGNLTRYIDAKGAETRLEYAGLGEIARRILPDGHSIEYQYDTEERLIGVTNQRGETYRLHRDALGRIVAEVDYWGQARNYGYTACGHLIKSADPLGRVIRYQNDPLGQILKKVLTDSAHPEAEQTETFEYDPNGNVVACANAAIGIERQFDPEGRLVEERQSAGCVVSNAYDAAGNRITRATTREIAGRRHTLTVQYAYDALDQATRAEIEGHAPVEFSRNALGQLTEERLGALVRRRLDYDADGHLTAQRVLAAEGPLLEQHYRYDPSGNLIQKRDSAYGIDQYRYDPVGRVIAHLDPQGRLRPYLNDPAGDRLRTRVHEPGQDAEWRREGEYESIFYRFDRAGNLTERTSAEGDTQFAWDANQRLASSTTRGTTTTYHYDPLGRRVRKQTGDTTTHFCWDRDFLLGDASVSHGKDAGPMLHLVREWVPYPDTFEPLAMVQRSYGASTQDAGPSEFYYYHNDPNGCPTRLLDSAGNVVWAALHGGWGRVEQRPVDLVDNPIRLQGQYEDRETGLHYNRYRYYDARVGQYISQDPIGLLAGPQLYLLAPNSLSWIDPLGLNCKETVGGLRAAGKKDAHHVIQDAAMRDLPGYHTNLAPGIHLPGPSNVPGTPHNIATRIQRQAGGGTYAAERRIGYKAMREAGVPKDEARAAIQHADEYFASIGVGPHTVTRIPGNR